MARYVAPSLLAARGGDLLSAVDQVEKAGADLLHFDVMDGIFVPATSFTLAEFQKIRKAAAIPTDVHIMVADPLRWGELYAKAGAHIVTFHLEAVKDMKEGQAVISIIKGAGAKVGISLKPLTPVEAVFPYLPFVDLVLVMSVEPGKGGQAFLPEAITRISKIKAFLHDHELDHVLIEVDGGINAETGRSASIAGADILVAGTYVYQGDVKERITALR